MPRRPRIAPGAMVYHLLNRAVAPLAVEVSVGDESVASPHGEPPRHAMDAPAGQEGQEQVTVCERGRKRSCVPLSPPKRLKGFSGCKTCIESETEAYGWSCQAVADRVKRDRPFDVKQSVACGIRESCGVWCDRAERDRTMLDETRPVPEPISRPGDTGEGAF